MRVGAPPELFFVIVDETLDVALGLIEVSGGPRDFVRAAAQTAVYVVSKNAQYRGTLYHTGT